jgi:hypothetical protein
MRARVLLLLPFATLAACSGGKSGDSSDSSHGDDSGSTDSKTNYAPGCITVDGGGGYAYIQDAISVAKDGSTIALCAGTYAEAVTVDKAVQIVGENRDSVIIAAPANSAAFTVTATGATLKTFTITTTKDGIVFDGATDSHASDFIVNAPPNYGVAFNNAVSSSVEDCTIDTPGYTGVKISGGSPTVARCNLPHATSYTITVQDDAEATLDSNTFDGVVSTTDTDGYAVYVNGATAHLTHNQVLGADVGGVQADTATLTMDSDTITGVAIGVLATTSTFTGTGLSINEAAIIGVLAAGPGTESLSDSTVTVTDDSSCANPYASFWSSRNPSVACGGVVAVGG